MNRRDLLRGGAAVAALTSAGAMGSVASAISAAGAPKAMPPLLIDTLQISTMKRSDGLTETLMSFWAKLGDDPWCHIQRTYLDNDLIGSFVNGQLLEIAHPLDMLHINIGNPLGSGVRFASHRMARMEYGVAELHGEGGGGAGMGEGGGGAA